MYARDAVNGVAFIARKCKRGRAFSTVRLRITRAFPIGSRARLELLAEAFNLLNRRNDVARVAVFGTGAYPTNPAANFGQVTVVGEPRTVQLGVRVRF